MECTGLLNVQAFTFVIINACALTFCREDTLLVALCTKYVVSRRNPAIVGPIYYVLFRKICQMSLPYFTLAILLRPRKICGLLVNYIYYRCGDQLVYYSVYMIEIKGMDWRASEDTC